MSPRSVPGAIPSWRATPTSWAGCPVSFEPLGPTQMSTGTDEVAMVSMQLGELGVAQTTDPVVLTCRISEVAPAASASANRLLDEVDEHRIDEPTDLHDVDEGGTGGRWGLRRPGVLGGRRAREEGPDEGDDESQQHEEPPGGG